MKGKERIAQLRLEAIHQGDTKARRNARILNELPNMLAESRVIEDIEFLFLRAPVVNSGSVPIRNCRFGFLLPAQSKLVYLSKSSQLIPATGH